MASPDCQPSNLLVDCRFAARLAQLTITPRGVPVDPEVNCNSAHSARSWVRTIGSAALIRSSVSASGSRDRPATRTALSTVGNSSGEVSTLRGLALRSIALIRSIYAASSPNVGGAICVTVAPHNQTAYIAATHRCPVGLTMQA